MDERVACPHLRTYMVGFDRCEVIDKYCFVMHWKDPSWTAIGSGMNLFAPIPRFIFTKDETGQPFDEESAAQQFNEHWFAKQFNFCGCGPYTITSFRQGERGHLGALRGLLGTEAGHPATRHARLQWRRAGTDQVRGRRVHLQRLPRADLQVECPGSAGLQGWSDRRAPGVELRLELHRVQAEPSLLWGRARAARHDPRLRPRAHPRDGERGRGPDHHRAELLALADGAEGHRPARLRPRAREPAAGRCGLDGRRWERDPRAGDRRRDAASSASRSRSRRAPSTTSMCSTSSPRTSTRSASSSRSRRSSGRSSSKRSSTTASSRSPRCSGRAPAGTTISARSGTARRSRSPARTTTSSSPTPRWIV